MSYPPDLIINQSTHNGYVENGYDALAIGNHYLQGKVCKIYSYTKDAKLGWCSRITRLACGLLFGLPLAYTPCCYNTKLNDYFIIHPWFNEIEFEAIVMNDVYFVEYLNNQETSELIE